jgi:uncharacterized protein YrzB (UPF0473 family)
MEQDSDIGSRNILTLALDGETPLDYVVLSVFTVDDRQYIALLPKNSDGGIDEDAPIYKYRYHLMDDDDYLLENIEDDDEYDNVTDYLNDLLSEEEFEDFFEEIQ